MARRGDGARPLGKGAGGDVTTVLDRAIEEEVLALVPDGVRVLTEEAGEAGDPESDALLIIDPLDGSHNATRGIPAYSISLAVAHGGDLLGDVEAAYIRHLVTGDEWTATRGEGAVRNGGSIAPSGELHTIATELYPSGPEEMARAVAPLSLGRKVRGIGTVAIDLAYVADGTVDAFVDLRGLGRTFDLAAGYLIVKEAGGLATDDAGRDLGGRPCAFDERCSVIATGTEECLHMLLRTIPPE
ncbi:MAG: hypothetical protein L0Z54_06135 [Thermoplasmata archaeon]|nr:hypothetical protein [Thermoplasmata archaeon]